MPRKVIEEFKIEYIQVMDENGKVDEKLMPKIDKKTILKMYKTMVIENVLTCFATALCVGLSALANDGSLHSLWGLIILMNLNSFRLIPRN